MSDIKVLFGKRVRLLRQKNEMTQEYLAEIANISVSFLGGIERGVKSPTLDTIEKLAQAFKMPISQLLSFDAGPEDSDEEKKLRALLTEYARKINELYR